MQARNMTRFHVRIAASTNPLTDRSGPLAAMVPAGRMPRLSNIVFLIYPAYPRYPANTKCARSTYLAQSNSRFPHTQ
jgi:hypothetical protein